jgi:hypothetical protein
VHAGGAGADRTAWKYYIVYIVVQIFLVAFAYFFLIETKGYTIEEVSRLFDGKAEADELAETCAVPDLEEDKEKQLYIEQTAQK